MIKVLDRPSPEQVVELLPDKVQLRVRPGRLKAVGVVGMTGWETTDKLIPEQDIELGDGDSILLLHPRWNMGPYLGFEEIVEANHPKLIAEHHESSQRIQDDLVIGDDDLLQMFSGSWGAFALIRYDRKWVGTSQGYRFNMLRSLKPGTKYAERIRFIRDNGRTKLQQIVSKFSKAGLAEFIERAYKEEHLIERVKYGWYEITDYGVHVLTRSGI